MSRLDLAVASRSLAAALLLGACAPGGTDAAAPAPPAPVATTGSSTAATAGSVATDPADPASPAGTAVATFAMGCFWCAEDAFEGREGVLAVVSGYTGGREKNPTYEQVSGHRTGHYEAIAVTYDPSRVTYEELLETFWHNVDPFDASGQFCDRGNQYRAAVFVHDDEQRRLAEESKQQAARRLGKPVATAIVTASTFYEAEAYHQDYAQRNPLRYRLYTNGCGRYARLREVWGKAGGP
jgi:peptide-methionine (S)-S-oxide reductase